jgi:hypothetical protein
MDIFLKNIFNLSSILISNKKHYNLLVQVKYIQEMKEIIFNPIRKVNIVDYFF